MTRPNKFERLIRGAPAMETKEYRGKSYFSGKAVGSRSAGRAGSRSYSPALLRLNDRTLVRTLADEAIRDFIDAKLGSPKFIDARLWKAFEGDHAVVALEASQYAQLVPSPATTSEWTFQSLFSPLWKNATWWVAGGRAGNKLHVHGLAVAASREDAEKVRKTVEAGLTLGVNLAGTALAAARTEKRTPNEAFNVWALEAVEPLLASIRTQSEGNLVRLEGSVDTEVVKKMLPPIGEARKAADRARSVNNLKQIALAMHNYYDVYKRFPPSVLYGPDGKTRYSWRVALLPFLEQAALYNQYRFDEPWDGPNNLRLAQTRVPVYQSPGEAGRLPTASYFALVGPGTMFDGTDGTRFEDIRDGSSNTIMFVEGKRNILWSKPEDISYDPKKPIPELGGYFEGGFHAALCDGAVHFLPKSIAEATLRAMITRNGREVIDWSKEVYKR